jgi:hypothetical protein
MARCEDAKPKADDARAQVDQTKPKASGPTPKPATAAKGLASKRSAARDEPPRVKTAEEMRASASSMFLPTESSAKSNGRYANEKPEPKDLLPWQQSSFFGIESAGQFFVYVVDCSESMIDEDRFARATIELRRSVLALKQPQRFEVIFYNKTAIPMPGGPKPRSADTTQKNQLLAWLRLIEPVGTTDPRRALQQALSLRPDAVFLLSDGEFPNGTVEDVIKQNTQLIPIHCIDLAGGLGGNQMERIARTSGGRYASRPVNNLRARP